MTQSHIYILTLPHRINLDNRRGFWGKEVANFLRDSKKDQVLGDNVLSGEVRLRKNLAGREGKRLP